MPRWLQFTLFVTVFMLVYGGGHFYVLHRFVVMLGLRGSALAWPLRIATIFLACSFLLARVLVEWNLNRFSGAFYWAASAWMGVFNFLFFLTLMGNLVWLALHFSGLSEKIQNAGFNDGAILSAAIIGISLVLSAFGIYEARCSVRTAHVDVPVKASAANVGGFTIAQISDVHLGVIVHNGRMREIVERINAEKPDLVLITGDLMDENADRMQEVADPIKDLHPPFGVFAVTGNHEYYAGAEKIIRHAKEIGVRFLTNEKVVLPNGLILYGINDPTAEHMGGRSVPFEELIGAEARTAPAILMFHQPRRFEKAADLGIDLMLSGHTHRGQIWPLSYVVRLFFPRSSGLYAYGASHLYVSRGIGTWGPPMRLDSPPELAIFKLKSAR